MTTIPERELFRPDELAQLMRVSVRTVYHYISLREIRIVRWKRRIRISREEVVRLVKSTTAV